MVQERDIKPRKVQEADLDRPTLSRDYTPPRNSPRDSSVVTDVASGLALLLSVIAFFFSVYAVFQAVAARRAIDALQSPRSELPNAQAGGGGASLAEPESRPILPQVAPYRFDRIQPGQYVQPAYEGAAQVELLSATRPNIASNIVTIEMRIRRSSEPLQTAGEINLAQTSTLNTRTNESFPLAETRSPETIFLSNLRPGEAKEATVAVRVPTGLDRIDLGIPGTRVFRNVPISTSNS